MVSVFLYAPNVIGYFRVAFLIASLFFLQKGPEVFVVLYAVSYILDCVDGPVARAMGQTSKFGAVFDMVTDRSSTALLLATSAGCYPLFAPIFLSLILLDISAHWMQMYSSLVSGKTSHKDANLDHSPLLRLYYKNRKFMGLLCVSAELYNLLVFLGKNTKLHFVKVDLASHVLGGFLPFGLSKLGLNDLQIASFVVLPLFLTKHLTSVLQFYYSAQALATLDTKKKEN